MHDIILASSSPQRRSLLHDLGVAFRVEPSTVDEDACGLRDPVERAAHLARLKASDVASRAPGHIVIGCDTLVVAPTGELLEKPADAADAVRMLRLQRAGTSVVHSGLCVLAPDGAAYEGMSSSRVRFGAFDEATVAWWVRLGLWEGRSGAFQIDGPGQLLIEHIDGDWTGIVGLPVHLLGQLLERVGAPLTR